MQAKESDHINAKYEKELAYLDEQIEARKGEPRPRQVRKRNSPKPSKASKKPLQPPEDSLESQMTALLRKIDTKSRQTRLHKDDHEAYCEAQSQFDLLFEDVATEILRMKRTLRKRFAKVNAGKGRRLNRRRSDPEVHPDKK